MNANFDREIKNFKEMIDDLKARLTSKETSLKETKANLSIFEDKCKWLESSLLNKDSAVLRLEDQLKREQQIHE